MRINFDDPLGKLKILLYGPPGSGKTHFIGTAPEPVLVINTDVGGYDTLRPAISRGRKIIVEDFSEVDYSHKKYKELILFMNKLLKGEIYSEVSTIALDSESGLKDIFMEMATDLQTYVGSPKSIPTGALGEPNRSHYHGEGFKCREVIFKLLGLDKHVIVTYHERPDFRKLNENEQEVMAIYPFVRGGNLSSSVAQICRNFSEVYHMSSQPLIQKEGNKSVLTKQYCVETVPIGLFKATKSRKRGDSPPYVLSETEPADLELIVNKIQSYYKRV